MTIAAAMTLAAFVCSSESSAQTGAPSPEEIGNASSGEIVSNGDAQVEDYARSLMVVHGRRRAEALVAARTARAPTSYRHTPCS